MFGKFILILVISGIIVNTSFAVQPQFGNWGAKGIGDATAISIDFSFFAPSTQEVLFRFIVDLDDGTAIAIFTFGTLTVNNPEGKISCNYPKIDGLFDSKTTAHGTWEFDLGPRLPLDMPKERGVRTM